LPAVASDAPKLDTVKGQPWDLGVSTGY
jgi:hypothetical protein